MMILYEEEQGYVGLTYNDFLHKFIMHVKLHQWNKSEFERYLLIWAGILQKLKDQDHKVVYSLVASEPEEKFNFVFGFKPTEWQVHCDDGITRRLLRLDIE